MTTLAVVPDATDARVTRRAARPAEWTLTGQPLRDPRLRTQIVDVLNQISDVPGAAGAPPPVDARNFESALPALDHGHDQVSVVLKQAAQRPGRSRLVGLTDLLLDIERVRLAVLHARHEQRAARFADVQAALARLRGVSTVSQIMERGPAALCRCGFDRVLLSRVQDSIWYVVACHVEGDPEWAKEIVRVAQAQAKPVDHMLLESEMLRRRAPVLVRDAQSDPRTNRSIGAVSLSRSYVAAPIIPEGRVIGFLHADCYQSRRHVDEDDRAVLSLFAEGFGYVFQRTVLLERMLALRDTVQEMTRSMSCVAEDVCGAETRLAPFDRADAATAAGAGGATIFEPQPRLESLLSRREIEVLQLMAMGHTNRKIATHLTISEGTVKSHVKHILRKTRAANRAEAVFRFMRITRGGGPPVGTS